MIWFLNNELRILWKEAIAVQFHTLSRNLPRKCLCSFVSFMAWTSHQILFGRSSQRKNRDQDGRKSSRGMHYRSQEYEDGGNELGIEKNGGIFWGMNGWSRQRGRHWWGMLHVWGRKQIWWENPKERNWWENQEMEGENNTNRGIKVTKWRT